MTEVTKEFIQKNEDEKIIEIEIERLRSFKNHPFQVKDDNEMHLLKESIEKYGILTPLIVRPVPDGVYEIIAGHRRRHAAELLGYRKVPVIIRVMNEDEAILNMVDSNLHREKISFSEKAFAYKMKNDVLKRKSGRKKGQIDHKTKKKRTVEIISEECGDSPKQVQRYISLTKLIPEFLQKLDDELISFNPAVEISALKEEEQKQLLEAMDYAQAVPSLSQAQRIKKLSKENQLTLEKMQEIMSEIKKGEITTIIGPNGSGKSTLLKALTRLLRCSMGCVYLNQEDLYNINSKKLAKCIGVLPQRHCAPPDFKVRDLVGYGRVPYQNWYEQNTEEDEKIIEWALKATGTWALRDKSIQECSGGESQRVWIATVLAQQPEILFLDEPTTYLDIAHQQETMKLVKRLNHEAGIGVVMVLHDLSHALEISDRIIVLKNGCKYGEGRPQDIITPKMMREVYDVDCDVVQIPGRKKPLIMFKEIS